MASAILTSRNNSRSTDFIPKFDHSTLNFTSLHKLPNRNPNPNPNFTNFVVGNTCNTGRDVIRSSQPPEFAFINSPIGSVPVKPSGYRYITFRLDKYTKTELKGLKNRLISDLQRVRILRQLVSATPVPKTTPSAVVNHTDVKRIKPLPKTTPFVRDVKKPLPKTTPFVRDVKKPCGRVTIAQKRKLMMRECSQILGKLMKHKHGWVFNTPVDAAAMKLYDYHNVISKPMDLGTIKLKLIKNGYDSPLTFAADVRLTFENAMVYNGKGSDVYVMAERLLLMFEDMFGSTHSKLVANQTRNAPVLVEKRVANAMIVVGTPVVQSVNKREMTVEEKSELASSLLNLQLRPEGMHQIMGIVKKGAGLERQGDEIELDLAVLDNETLWELHSFIGRSHKETAEACNMISSVQTDNCRERDDGEEDVDIGEEMQLTNFPSVVIEKDVVNGSGSRGDSSSDSDTSSDSGSGTSCNEHEVNSTPKGVVQ